MAGLVEALVGGVQGAASAGSMIAMERLKDNALKLREERNAALKDRYAQASEKRKSTARLAEMDKQAQIDEGVSERTFKQKMSLSKQAKVEEGKIRVALQEKLHELNRKHGPSYSQYITSYDENNNVVILGARKEDGKLELAFTGGLSPSAAKAQSDRAIKIWELVSEKIEMGEGAEKINVFLEGLGETARVEEYDTGETTGGFLGWGATPVMGLRFKKGSASPRPKALLKTGKGSAGKKTDKALVAPKTADTPFDALKKKAIENQGGGGVASKTVVEGAPAKKESEETPRAPGPEAEKEISKILKGGTDEFGYDFTDVVPAAKAVAKVARKLHLTPTDAVKLIKETGKALGIAAHAIGGVVDWYVKIATEPKPIAANVPQKKKR